MPTPTYDLIEEKILSSTAASVSFNSISGAYRDLVLEVVSAGTTPSGDYGTFRVNGDSGTNYSNTGVSGNGTAAGSYRATNSTALEFSSLGTGVEMYATMQFLSYANTTTYKTVLTRASNANNVVYALVGLWRSTSAITSITVLVNGSNSYKTGTVVRLWGVA